MLLRFATEQNLGSIAIRYGTWSDFSHVDFVLADKTLLGARIKGGVQIRPANYGNFTKSCLFVVDIPNPSIEVTVFNWAKSQIGKPYDWRAILGFAFRRDWTETDSWFCSEFVAAAFRNADYPLIRADHLNRVAPQDLLLSPYLTRVE